jgi:hypothetical protein
MSTAELVDNPSEIIHIEDVSEDDIFNAVQSDSHEEKEDLAEGACCDADNSNDDMPIVSRQEALQAALLVWT